MLSLWSRSQHCQCLQEGRSPWPVASPLGQSLVVSTPAGSSRPRARLPELLFTAQTTASLGSLLASLAPCLGTKLPSPSWGSSLGTRLTITVFCIRLVTRPQWCNLMWKHYQNLPLCSEDSALWGGRGRERVEMLSSQWRRGSGLPSPSSGS